MGERTDRKIRNGLGIFSVAAGIFCTVYFLLMAVFTGLASKFNFIWLPMGLVLTGGGIFLLKSKKVFSKTIRNTFLAVAAIGLILFLNVGGLILSGFFQSGEENLDYVIVLGAQMKASGPSMILKARLDEAIRYLEENPETKVIVSGGQGSDEPVSEAAGMKAYLVENGVEEGRIFMEDKSVNTNQNLKFSAEYINIEEEHVGIVTSNFHIYRSVKLAEKLGYENVCGIAADSYAFLLPANMLRECACVVYYTMTGGI